MAGGLTSTTSQDNRPVTPAAVGRRGGRGGWQTKVTLPTLVTDPGSSWAWGK